MPCAPLRYSRWCIRGTEELGIRAIHVDELRIDREHRGGLRGVCMEAVLEPHPLAGILRGHAVPVADRKRTSFESLSATLAQAYAIAYVLS